MTVGDAGLILYFGMKLSDPLYARFIVNVTLAFRKGVGSNKLSHQPILISGPKAPKFVINLIQCE